MNSFDRFMVFTPIVIIVGLFIFTGAVLFRIHDDHINAQAEELLKTERLYQYPPIPRCDKPLWDRIREGCNERSN